jgi:hypothetical protein
VVDHGRHESSRIGPRLLLRQNASWLLVVDHGRHESSIGRRLRQLQIASWSPVVVGLGDLHDPYTFLAPRPQVSRNACSRPVEDPPCHPYPPIALGGYSTIKENLQKCKMGHWCRVGSAKYTAAVEILHHVSRRVHSRKQPLSSSLFQVPVPSFLSFRHLQHPLPFSRLSMAVFPLFLQRVSPWALPLWWASLLPSL